MSLTFYVDNVRLLYTDTCFVRGNVVSDCYGHNITGIEVKNCDTARVKNNKVFRMRATSHSDGFKFTNISDLLAIYNTSSRCHYGFNFSNITTLNVYNLTSHNCNQHVVSSAAGNFYNIALSNFKGHSTYKNAVGFAPAVGVTLTVNFVIYKDVGTLVGGSGTVHQGSTISEKDILYIDEPDDDLSPDYISELVESGTSNPLNVVDPAIGGIEPLLKGGTTSNKAYYLNLIDNSFWDIYNPKSGEISFIKAFQSRILANVECATNSVENDYYIKLMESVLRFAELYPMNAYYQNTSKFRKNVSDMWYSGQNCGALTAYNNAIGGYNLFPSFFKRSEDYADYWTINESFINHDNWLLGNEDQKYGMVVDCIGISTLTRGASAECYHNTMNSVGDLAPIRWTLHEEVQPSTYLLFTDLYNGFEGCTLTNMLYNDDFNINIEDVDQNGEIITPYISTESIATSGHAASGVELSTLDRIYSENVTRIMYYRQGDAPSSMGPWTEIIHPIGEVIPLNYNYIQFKITVENVLRIIDYEFIGLCLRPYTSSRDWTLPQT